MPKSETSKKFLGTRGKALEEAFFESQNSQLIERMRKEEALHASQEGLAHISGVSDPILLRKLVELQIGPETWAALALIPLLEVAWADGALDDKERRAIVSAAEAGGIHPGSPSHALLENWIERRPDARLLQVWGEAMVELCEVLGPLERASLKREVIGRATAVAKASGGILGFGKKISEREQKVLAELERALAG
jgi:tellurite resistance protein